MKEKFQIGDLVQFDFSHSLGVVIGIKEECSFDHYDDIFDVLVCWSDGEIFWCMDFTLRHLSQNQN